MLVNTIGAFHPEDVLATTPEMLRLMLDVNLGPALWLTRRDAPAAPTRSGGRPIVIQLSRNSGTACSSTTWWTS